MKVAEKGITVVIGTTYDLSSKTALEVTLIDPSGNTSTVADGDITVNSGSYNAGTLGTFDANKSCQFDTTETMFDEAGTWSGYLKYTDSGKILYGNTFTITVEAVP